ncbi:hypothetical protein EGW08_010910 [Elysia chlorotica]|uniref:Uncharacterized protein n=1 Tax=Elysia chlorotica TaxID=188477 RepID=A0A3S1C2T1_ELYCH|nr:hypothetical protein EGW08_010910 [Elysia chlorotica]
MTLTIQGSRGEDTAIIAPDGPIYMWEALPWRTVVPVRENIGEIQRAALSYKRRNVINRRWLRVSKLVLEDLLNNKKYSTLREFRIKNDMQVKLRLWKTRHDWTNNGKRMRI